MKFKFSHFNFSVGTINFCIGSKLAIKIHALSEGKKSTFSFCCAILIFFALIPLNIFMYRNGVGIAIVEPGSLPFKLVGITFYIRNYIAPLLLTYLYAKSDRNYILTIVIFVYAIIVGIVSLSKGNIVLTCIPVLLFAFIDKKPYKFVAALIFSMFLYGGVAWARQYVFLADVGSFDMIQMILTNSFSEDFWFHVNPIRVFSEFSNRLFGANVIVLANQYYLDEVGNHIFNFFWGNPDELNEIITFDVFGLQRVNGLVIGVSMGYIGTMLLLSQGNILLISVLSLITAIYLTICSCIVERYLKDDSFFSVLGYAFCFFFVFFLYEVHMTRFYFVVILSLFILFIIKHIKFKVNTPLISCNTHKQRQS